MEHPDLSDYLIAKPIVVTRSFKCRGCGKLSVLIRKTNGDIVKCQECGKPHIVKQRIEIKTSVEVIN
jgi:DNA-directed RNA polymerase subunit RPC12/RpoP